MFVCDIERGSGNLVVTGGQDDVAYVWNIMSGEICLVCEGHKVISHLIRENQTDICRTGSKLQAQYLYPRQCSTFVFHMGRFYFYCTLEKTGNKEVGNKSG